MTSPPSTTRSADSFFVSAISFEIAIGFGGLILGMLIGPEARLLVPQWHEWTEIGSGIIWGTVAAIPMVVAAVVISALPLESIRALQELTERRLLPFFKELSWAQIALFALTAGVCEEVFFRGWLQCWLTGPIDPIAPWQPQVVVGVVLGGVAFGACHAMTPVYFALATLAGIFLGFLLVESSNLLIPITAHAVYDWVMLTIMRHEKAVKKSA